MALVVDLLFFEPGAAVQQHLLVQPESTVADSVDRITQVSLTALWQLDPSDRMENTFLTFIFTFFFPSIRGSCLTVTGRYFAFVSACVNGTSGGAGTSSGSGGSGQR